MDEAIGMCQKFKNFENTKSLFINETGMTWEDATSKIPEFTNEEKLGQFVLKKEVTPEFKVHCRRESIKFLMLYIAHYILYCLILQTFCMQAKLAAASKPVDSASTSTEPDVVPEVLVHVGCETSVFSVDVPNVLVRVPFKNEPLVLLNTHEVTAAYLG